MQYHLNGFQPGDPSLRNSNLEIEAESGVEPIDVLIVGCGPAGLTLAAQLSQFPDIKTRIIERKNGPLMIGQADGIACRSMEMFEAFGFAEKVEKEAYWVNETSFWRPDLSNGEFRRADRIQDVEDGLSEFPHTILSQARVHDFFLEVMENSPSSLVPLYDRKFVSISPSGDKDFPHCVLVETTNADKEVQSETLNARYVVGCDGARSTVRQSLGLELEGEAARQIWGVMDVLAVTDFPDIRLKSAIQSADNGSLLIIPREGGFMVRMYIELDELHETERAADRNLSIDQLIAKARAIFDPYFLDVKEVAWWSAYEIGQRICSSFDNDTATSSGQNPTIFIAGDACHTHSPKAGQGMNVSMADSFNLGWKLASVIRNQAKPELLKTYSNERQSKAKELIDFDRDMARLFSAKTTDKKTSDQFQQYFAKHSRYTAGVETRYDTSTITGTPSFQSLATGYPVGMRFHSAPVIRLADAKPMHLAHTIKADGRWRLFLFGNSGDTGVESGKIAELCNWLKDDPTSPLKLFTPKDSDVDAIIDVRAVFQTHHRDLSLGAMPTLLTPSKGRFGLTDYEKIFCPANAPEADIFDIRGIDRSAGAVVVVRPDQFVAQVFPLEATEPLFNFFSKFMMPQS